LIPPQGGHVPEDVPGLTYPLNGEHAGKATDRLRVGRLSLYQRALDQV